MLDCYARCPSPMSHILIEHFHGAAVRVGADETAFPHRRAGYNFLVLGQWMAAADSAQCTAWVRETFAAMQPFMAPGRYVNYLGDEEGGGPLTPPRPPGRDRPSTRRARAWGRGAGYVSISRGSSSSQGDSASSSK